MKKLLLASFALLAIICIIAFGCHKSADESQSENAPIIKMGDFIKTFSPIALQKADEAGAIMRRGNPHNPHSKPTIHNPQSIGLNVVQTEILRLGFTSPDSSDYVTFEKTNGDTSQFTVIIVATQGNFYIPSVNEDTATISGVYLKYGNVDISRNVGYAYPSFINIFNPPYELLNHGSIMAKIQNSFDLQSNVTYPIYWIDASGIVSAMDSISFQ